jgi:hypothetical protein
MALEQAGWKINRPAGTLWMMGSPTGITINARNMKSPASELLLESLRKIGLEVRGIEFPNQESDVINLRVGGKPL